MHQLHVFEAFNGFAGAAMHTHAASAPTFAGPSGVMPPHRAGFAVPAPRCLAAALGAAADTYRTAPHALAAPLSADAPRHGATGVRGEPAAFRARQ